MSARVEAAAKVYAARFAPLVPFEEIRPVAMDVWIKDAAEVLAAADAVMFDDAAVERAAISIAVREGVDANFWKLLRTPIKEKYRGDALAVIAALKGDDT